MSNSRDEILALLGGRRLARLPVFGGLPSLTHTGLEAAGVVYAQAHADAGRMAAAAASTAQVFGYEAAVVPFDLCVEAEALGAAVDFQRDTVSFGPPLVVGPLSKDTIPALLNDSSEVASAGRVPVVVDALKRLRSGIGRQVVVGAWVPGPFTLGWQLYGIEAWMEVVTDPDVLTPRLALLGDLLARVAAAYREAGADFITVHEMGGSPQVVGPRVFQRRVKPAVARLVAQIRGPVVLSVCGDTNAVVEDLAGCGATALNLDHRNDLARTRQRLGPAPLLFGNFDPVGVLSEGTPETVAETVRAIAAARADAVWPGCDLWPDIPEANFHALILAAAQARG